MNTVSAQLIPIVASNLKEKVKTLNTNIKSSVTQLNAAISNNVNVAVAHLHSSIANQINAGAGRFTTSSSQKLKTISDNISFPKNKPYISYSESLYNTGMSFAKSNPSKQHNPKYVSYLINKPKTKHKAFPLRANPNKYDAFMSDLGISGYTHFEKAVIRDLEKREEQKVEATIHTLFENPNIAIEKLPNLTHHSNFNLKDLQKVAASDLHIVSLQKDNNTNQILHFNKTKNQLNKAIPMKQQNNLKLIDKEVDFSKLEDKEIGFLVNEKLNASFLKNINTYRKNQKTSSPIDSARDREQKTARIKYFSDSANPLTTTMLPKINKKTLDGRTSRLRVSLPKTLDIKTNDICNKSHMWYKHNHSNNNLDVTTPFPATSTPTQFNISKRSKKHVSYGQTILKKSLETRHKVSKRKKLDGNVISRDIVDR